MAARPNTYFMYASILYLLISMGDREEPTCEA
jgi:hypothetical protein